ncbi:MAG TPA: metal-dependent transcriptional regulator [Candidatus Dormibacteraeota bacterium]|nr:metal-dependent transcriptional regulator [Candidatus Dormibacteraeota bacterium]
MMTELRSRRRLTQAQEDYLKTLYELGGHDGIVGTKQLAAQLGVSAASATEMMGKLAAQRLVVHDRYRGASLTDDGLAVALEIVRHHRLVEMYLTRKLGYGWDEVHDEAEQLEHVISERMEARIFEALGRPDVDCHGDPIPTLGGEVAPAASRSLLDARAGERVTIRRVSDRDPGKLRVLDKLGLRLGVEVEVLAVSEYEGPIEVRVGGRRRQVPLGIARVVFVQ